MKYTAQDYADDKPVPPSLLSHIQRDMFESRCENPFIIMEEEAIGNYLAEFDWELKDGD